jgi:hypothetical protein
MVSADRTRRRRDSRQVQVGGRQGVVPAHLVVDYSNPGAVVRVSPQGKVLWRCGPTGGTGRLDHPSLAVMLPDGTVAVNDDFRSRVIVIDPRTNRIVWQHGMTDVGGRSPVHLLTPDGIDIIPAGTKL